MCLSFMLGVIFVLLVSFVLWHFVHVMFITILHKFGSYVIYFSFSSVFLVRSLSLGSVRGFLVWVHLASFFVYFALLFSCTLHVRSLLVILCSFPCLLFCCFQLPCFLRVSMVETSKKRVGQYFVIPKVINNLNTYILNEVSVILRVPANDISQ